MLSGVYQITNTINGKRYIGSTKNIKSRKNTHFSALRMRKHHNPHLQAAWVKYGEESFSFICLERCDVPALLEREQHWLDSIHPEYNVLPIAGRPTGYIVSEITRRKRSAAFKGRVVPDSTRKKTAAALRGRKVPRDVIERALRTRAGRKRKPLSPEHRAKITKALSGRKRGPLSQTTKQKIATKAIGRFHNDETKAKISRNRSGLNLGPRSSAIGQAIALAKAVMSEADIREIRALANSGGKHRDIAAIFGIAKTTIGQIVRRQTYKWVNG